jgi:hypothetical protein
MNWVYITQEIQVIATFWDLKQKKYPYLCDYLQALKTQQQQSLNNRVLEGAITESQNPYPNLYCLLQYLSEANSDPSFYEEVIYQILKENLHIDSDTQYNLDSTLLFLDDPSVPISYNILFDKDNFPPEKICNPHKVS